MSRLIHVILLSLLVFLVLSFDTKKGIGCPTSVCTTSLLTSLNVNWYYNWNSVSTVASNVPFIPMCFSNKNNRITNLPDSSRYLLGFNEPDNDNQANMTVDEAYTNWSLLVGKSATIASPVMASNPVAPGSWLELFMNKVPTPKVDYIAVHWYGGNYASSFKTRMTDIYNKFGKPIWITEFACQTVSSASTDPNKYTQVQVNTFLDNVIPWMQMQPWIERYAWHDSKAGTSALWLPDGTLTETGKKYASF